MSNEIQSANLPEGWVWTTIGELGIIVSGGTPSTKNKEFWGSEISWITPADLSNYDEKYIAKGARDITKIGLEHSSAKLLPQGAILFSSRAPIGYSVIAKNELATSQGFKNLIPMGEINSEYIYYYFLTLKSKAEDVASGTTFLELSAENFSKLSFPLCSLIEQKAIVNQINSLFSKLKEAEIGLKNAERKLEIYKQALLKKAFEGKLTEQWRQDNNIESAKILLNNIESERQCIYVSEVQKWRSAIEQWKIDKTISGRPSKPSKPIIPNKLEDNHLSKQWGLPKSWEWTQLGLITFITKLAGFEYTDFVRYDVSGDLSVIKAENVGRNGFKKTEYSKVVSETVSHLKRTQLGGGELIIVFVGSGIGNIAIVPENHVFFLGPNIAMARPYGGVNSKYIEYFYNFSKGKDLLLVSAKAVAQPSLSMSNIRQTPIAIPPLNEQLYMVQILDFQFTLMENLNRSISNVLNKIAVLKHSILKKAFEGRLVKNNNTESAVDLLEQIRIEKIEYLKLQKELVHNKPKQKKQMEEKKSVLEVLKESSTPITVQQLWESSSSDGDIEMFYSQIKDIYDQIIEVKSETESLLSLKK